MHDSEHDEGLLARVRAGDEAALHQLYLGHATSIRRRLLGRCRDPDLVDQAVQDTFMTVWRHPERYRGEGTVNAWLWGIAVRRLVDVIRRQRRQPLLGLSTHRSVEDQALEDLQYGELGQLLDQLPTELLTVVQAVVLDGLTNRQAGTLLGLPTGTVKTRMMRARRILRAEMS